MKYRLLKTLGGMKPGTMFSQEGAGREYPHAFMRGVNVFIDLPIELATDPNWFEEVKPWVPKDGEEFWYINANLNPQKATDNIPMPEDTYETPLYPFRTEAEAESCAAALRMTLTAWKEAHP